MFDTSKLDPEIQKKVYRPGVDGLVEDVEIENPRPTTYSGGEWELIDEGEPEE